MPVITQQLELEEYVQRRLWMDRVLCRDCVDQRVIGSMSTRGRATWEWRFSTADDLVLYQLTWG